MSNLKICCWWELGAVNFCEPVKLIPQQFLCILSQLVSAVLWDVCSASLYRTKLVTGKWENRGFFMVVLKLLHFSKLESESFRVTQEHKTRWALLLNVCIVKEQVLPAIVQLGSCVFFISFVCFKPYFMLALRNFSEDLFLHCRSNDVKLDCVHS